MIEIIFEILLSYFHYHTKSSFIYLFTHILCFFTEATSPSTPSQRYGLELRYDTEIHVIKSSSHRQGKQADTLRKHDFNLVRRHILTFRMFK